LYFSLVALVSSGRLLGQTQLTSGVPVQFLINTLYRVVLNGKNGYVIPIPSNPIQLEVKVEMAPATAGVLVYIRCGQDIGGVAANNPVYDTVGPTLNGLATIVLERPNGGADGNCYVALEPVQGTGNAGTTGGRLTATIKPFPSGTPVTVSSLGSIYLAGQAPGTKLGNLTVPSNSPIQVPISLTAGQGLNILAGGLMTPPGGSVGIPPDGSGPIALGANANGTVAAAFGLSATAVFNMSLVGVFTGDTVDSTNTPLGLDYRFQLLTVPTLYPALQQVFYIGNGVNLSGQPRVFVIPQGATHLYLASISGGFNISGTFNASVSPASIPSVPAATNPMIVSPMADLFLADQPNGAGFGKVIASNYAPYSVPVAVPIQLTAGQNLHIVPLEQATLGGQSSTHAENGISTLPPANGFDGVFVGDTINTAQTPAGLDVLVTQQTTAPVLQQSFYIGNGYSFSGELKNFTVPAGATRLLLANAGGGVAALGFIAASVVPDNPNAPVINKGGIVNNAGFATGPVAPGSMVAIFGSNFGPKTFPSSLPLPTTLGGTQIFFNATPAPLVFVSPQQVVAQVPVEMYGLTKALVTPVNNGAAGVPTIVDLASFSGGIFTTGTGDPVIIDNNTGKLVSASSPASRGDVLIIWMTGLGPTLLDPATGNPAPGTASPALFPIRVGLKDSATGKSAFAPVQYAGLAPGFVALYQVNVQIPADFPTGTAILAVGTPSQPAAPPVTIGIK
jgi:uncharacterized protein (TIGR03437 family)